MYERILKDELRFPDHVPAPARDLLTVRHSDGTVLPATRFSYFEHCCLLPFPAKYQGLLAKDPAERLGASLADAADIQKHKFFASIDWAALERREVRPHLLSDGFEFESSNVNALVFLIISPSTNHDEDHSALDPHGQRCFGPAPLRPGVCQRDNPAECGWWGRHRRGGENCVV